MKTILSLLVLLAVSASAQPKYVGKHYGDGTGLSNLQSTAISGTITNPISSTTISFGTMTVGTLTATNGILTNVLIVTDATPAFRKLIQTPSTNFSMYLDNTTAPGWYMEGGDFFCIGGTIHGDGLTISNLNPANISSGIVGGSIAFAVAPVVTANNLSYWAGPSNTITLGNSPFTTHYVYSLTNAVNGISAITSASGHTNAGEWTASISLTNQWSTNHFVVLPADWRIYGESATNWLTLTNGTAMRVAVLASTNQWNNTTNAWVSWRKK